MRLNELFDASFKLTLAEGRRPDAMELIRLVKDNAPEVYELWLYGARATNTARGNDPWTFIAVIPDETTPQRSAELIHVLKGLRGAIPGLLLDFYICREGQRQSDVTPLYWAQRGEGKKFWADRSQKIA